ncbi:M56 family metallopeptidase [Aliiruegeria sabulilitoris]|uniref:M56 family metallopeptidase n=1 Tax=Aliiruegeria sabulilitoris TaxID=1510458 RepID=UPI00082D2625|nr:M56 family metallopeptidase [Aliiruegeria sabulilitoris]NDR56735.1 M56 family metallopeptidase [Pseudoruegeria sp. M32A2M]
MAAEGILNAWIDANILLLVLVAAWLPLRRVLAQGWLGQALMGQARAMEWIFISVVVAPFLARLVSSPAAGQFNLSDLLVAQYLDGNVEMSATQFETLLGLRADLTDAFLLQQAPWAQGLLVLLLLGLLVSVARLGLAVLRLRRMLNRAHVWRRFGRLELLISDDANVPFSTCGLRRRFVVLPSDAVAHGQDLHFTLAHEFQHLRQADLLHEFAVEALRPFFFWNPAFHICSRQLRELREMACDQALTLRRPVELGGYCRSLIRACGRARADGALFIPVGPAVGFVDSRHGTALNSQLGRRIVALTGRTPSPLGQKTWKAIGLLLCALLALGAVLMRSPTGWSHDRIMLSTIVNLERLDARNASQPRLSGSFVPTDTAPLARE